MHVLVQCRSDDIVDVHVHVISIRVHVHVHVLVHHIVSEVAVCNVHVYVNTDGKVEGTCTLYIVHVSTYVDTCRQVHVGTCRQIGKGWMDHGCMHDNVDNVHVHGQL